jgi:fucose permease
MPRKVLSRVIFLSSLLLFLLIGSLDSIRGLIAPYISDFFNLTLSQLGVILAAVPLGFLIAGPLSGYSIDRFGTKRIIIVTLILLIISIILIITTSFYLILALGFTLLGLSKGALETGLNTFVSKTFRANRAQYLGFLHAFYGGGSIVFPVTVGWLFTVGFSWQMVYMSLIGMFLIPLLTFSFFKELANNDEVEENKNNMIFGVKWFLLIAGVVFFYVGAEVGMLSWMPYYMETYKAMDKLIIPYVMGAFFACLTLGRLFGGYMTEKVGYEKSLLIAAIGSTVCLIIVQLPSQLYIVVIPLIGLFFSIIFPTAIALASMYFTKQIGVVIGFLSTAAGLGGMLATWLIGFMGEMIGFKLSFLLPIILMINVIIILFIIVIIKPKDHNQDLVNL